MHSRKLFLKQLGLLSGVLIAPRISFSMAEERVMTVSGPVNPSDLGFTLSHEHVLVDFIGAASVNRNRYHEDEVYTTALPYLMDVKGKGCKTFVDCTPAYIGRDAALLKRLSKASGLNIITTTGYYAAAQEKYVPAHAYSETAEQLSKRWITEWEVGVDGSGIKPGLIKTGVDKAPLSVVQKKLIDAAALTHLATGLTIGVHTGDGEAANEELEILKSRGVAPAARIWIHAQNEKNSKYHIEAAQRGSWVSFDGVSVDSIQENLKFLQVMKQHDLLKAVLVSHDSGWYHVGEPQGGKFNHYNTILTDFIPALKKNGFTQKDIDLIFITNPAKALTIGVKKIV